MRAALLTIALVSTAAILGCSESAPVTSDLVFGKFVKVTEDRYEIVTARSFVVGDALGWGAIVKPSRGYVQFREVYELPAPKMQIDKSSGTHKVTVSEDGRRIAVEGEIEGGSNVLTNSSWTVEESDPSGSYTMTLSLNNKEVQRFTYSVDATGR